MEVDVLIIGQGICGTLFSWFLQKEGKRFFIIDTSDDHSASKTAAGVINPVTGRRYVTTWMAEELLDFAELTYNGIGNLFGTRLLHKTSIIDFFPTPQMRNAFVDHISENDTYLHSYPDQNLFNPLFHYDFGCGEISPVYTVQFQTLLSLWRNELKSKELIREEIFEEGSLKVETDGVRYNDITAGKIVFCDGIASAKNSWFSLLPFSANKGEALLVRCEDMNRDHVFKKGMLLVPMPEEGMFWFGSNYQLEFEDERPSEKFYNSAKEILQHWLKLPFSIIDHKAAIRPATLERRPFVGFHPLYPSVGILNGMGTKGASLAPFFAHQLVQHIVCDFPIAPEADVHRFSRILSK